MPLKVDVGDMFEVELEAQRMAGFRWELVSKASDRLSLVEERFDPAASNPGAPGIQRFRFKAIAPGEVILRFEYTRPWAKDGVTKHREIPVRIDFGRNTSP
jgi:predicted secreted protein